MIDDRAYLPDKTDGVPVPNPRQAQRLDEAMEKKLALVVEDLAYEPDHYIPRFEAFAATLKGAWAATILAVGSRDLATINMSRKRARRFIGQIPDQELLEAFGTIYSLDTNRDRLVRAACGVKESYYQPYAYHQDTRHNVLFKNAQEFGRALPSSKFMGQKTAEDLPTPLAEGIVDYYNTTPGVNRRIKALKEASENFSRAYFEVKSNIGQSDHLFARRFSLMWELVDAEVKFENLNARLTKPLEDYVCRWTGWQRTGNMEYKHKGAQATWSAKLVIENLEKRLADNENLVNNPGWSISTLVKEADDAYQIFKIVLEHEDKKHAERTAALQKKNASRDKKLQEKQELAKIPIKISSVQNEDGIWIDHRALLEGLKGRTSISKAFGQSYLYIKGVIVETNKLRAWLINVLQDLSTGKRVPKSKWNQSLWANVGTREATIKHRSSSVSTIYFNIQVGDMRISTTFYDQSREVEEFKRRTQLIHTVLLTEVEAEIPELRGVWTPEDINTYHPVLAPA